MRRGGVHRVVVEPCTDDVRVGLVEVNVVGPGKKKDKVLFNNFTLINAKAPLKLFLLEITLDHDRFIRRT